jgi:hypothetical protein
MKSQTQSRRLEGEKMKNGYSHAAHVDAVIKSSRAKNGARAVLLEACRRATFGKPITTFTKNQIGETTGLCPRTVRMSLCDLRAEGVLVPVANFEGGRGKAVTYRLVIVRAMGAVEGVEPMESPEVAKVPPAVFLDWVKRDGYGPARERQKRVERGEEAA